MEFTCDEFPTDEENTNEEHISSMFLCDDTTIDLCAISHRIINILSLYHSFINNYTISDITNNNICSIISTCALQNGFHIVTIQYPEEIQ